MIYLICPVRNITEEQREEIEQYVFELERKQNRPVHYPPRDVDQGDPSGHRICEAHREALIKADEVHIFWDTTSKGSHFDLGMAYSLNKKIVLVKAYHEDVPQKSYLKVIQYENSKSIS